MIPKPLYELKPFFYGIIGTSNLIDAPNKLAVASGFLLIVATLFIFAMRWNYRRS